MKEYILFMGNYRHFIVIANSPKQAIERFCEAPELQRHGFTKEDITSVEVKG